MQLSILGHGRFGSLAARRLARHLPTVVHDPAVPDAVIRRNGVKPVDFKTACEADLILLCMPISELETVLKQISGELKPGSLVIDVCSVKEIPVDLMNRYLPADVEFLATHPMFGPDTAAQTMKRRKIVLCRGRISENRFQRIVRFLKRLNLQVIEETPGEHDRQIASSLLLTHFIGRALIDYDARELEIDTRGYQRLLSILKTVRNDSWQLFEDMNRYNRFASETRSRFLAALNAVESALPRGD